MVQFVAVVAFQLASMFALFRMSTGRLARNTLGFGPRDAVAITFCGVHKVFVQDRGILHLILEPRMVLATLLSVNPSTESQFHTDRDRFTLVPHPRNPHRAHHVRRWRGPRLRVPPHPGVPPDPGMTIDVLNVILTYS